MEIIERLLAKRPEERFQTADEVAEVLGQYLAHVQQPSRVELPNQAYVRSSSSLRSFGPPWRKLAATVGITALLMFGIFGIAQIAGLREFGTSHETSNGSSLGGVDGGAGSRPVEPTEPKGVEGPTQEGTLLLNRIQVDDVRVTVSGSGIIRTVESGGLSRIGLPKGIYKVEVFDPVQNALLRSGQLTINPGCIKVVTCRWSSLNPRYTQPLPDAELDGAEGVVNRIAVCRARSLLAVASKGTIQVWKPEGECWRILDEVPTNQKNVLGLAYSSSANVLAYSGKDGDIGIWELGTKPARVQHLDAGSGNVSSIAFSPDGNHLAAAVSDGIIRMYEVTSGEMVVVGSHDGEVRDVAFSPDGSMLASASTDMTVKLWDLSPDIDSRKPRTLFGHTGPVYSIAFSPDGRTLVSAGWDSSIKLWDVNGAKLLRSLFGHRGVAKDVEFSPNGSLVAAASMDQTVTIWEVETGLARADFHAHWAEVESIGFLADGERLVTGSNDGTARVWSLQDLPPTTPVDGPTPELKETFFAPLAFAVDPECNRLAVFDFFGSLRIWNADLCRYVMQPFQIRRSDSSGDLVAFARNGSSLATFDKKAIRVLEISNDGKKLQQRSQSSYNVPPKSVAISADGEVVAVIRSDGVVAIHDVSQRLNRVLPTGDDDLVTCMAFATEEALLAVGTQNGKVMVFDVAAEPTVRRTQSLGNSSVSALAFSPDTDTLATGTESGAIRMWNTRGEEESADFSGHEDKVYSLAFSHNGEILVSGGGDPDGLDASPLKWGTPGLVKFWDVSTGQLRARFSAHETAVFRAEFLPDDIRLVTTGGGSGVYIWDVEEILEHGPSNEAPRQSE